MVLAATYRLRNVRGGIYLEESDQHQDTIHGWSSNPKDEGQKWVFEPAGTGWRIKSLKHGRYVSASGNQKETPLKASIWSPDIWVIRNHGRGHAIYRKDSDLVIDLTGGKDLNGTLVNLRPFSGAQEQLWEMKEVEGQVKDLDPRQLQYKGAVPPGTYRVHSVHANTALDLYGGGKDENTPVLSYSVHTGPNQIWTFETGTYGYRIKNVASGTYLGFKELPKGKDDPATGKPPSQGTELAGHSQPVEWTVTQADKGYLIHWAENQELVIDLAEGKTQDGTKIIVWPQHGGDNQKWRIEGA
ncbi:hypothetical protein FRC00_009015 [Tulasnella sp. 408]|nr:hypothetical protein FRC00_009015 [Tulasnella sp. 408]